MIDRRNGDMQSNHFRFPVRSDIYESLVSLRYKITRSPKLRWISSYKNNRWFVLQLDISCVVCLPFFSLSLSLLRFIFFPTQRYIRCTYARMHTGMHTYAHPHPIIVVSLTWLSKFDKSGTPWLSLSDIFNHVMFLLCPLLLDILLFFSIIHPRPRINSYYSNR